MKIFSSEFGHNYGSYTFAYAHYAKREAGDSLAQIYDLGYLPYSAARGVTDTLYMARSGRVPLGIWKMTSENRRIAKKFDGTFEKKRIPVSEFTFDETFYSFCLDYFAQRHGEKTMPRERLELILTCNLISTIVEYTQAGKVAAYAFEVSDGIIGHYWFSFYDLTLVQQSLGLWLMLDCVRDAQAAGLTHYYLGTVYGEKALYKTNFEPLEWWTGQGWSTDLKALKERGRTDNTRVISLMDAWKEDQKLFT